MVGSVLSNVVESDANDLKTNTTTNTYDVKITTTNRDANSLKMKKKKHVKFFYSVSG